MIVRTGRNRYVIHGCNFASRNILPKILIYRLGRQDFPPARIDTYTDREIHFSVMIRESGVYSIAVTNCDNLTGEPAGIILGDPPVHEATIDEQLSASIERINTGYIREFAVELQKLRNSIAEMAGALS